MTLTLILTRHAKSDWGDPRLDDHDRPLNARGRDDAPKIGAWLKEKGHLPQQAILSTARRAQETWEGLLPALGTDAAVSNAPRLYHAEAETILDHLRGAEGQSVMMIGHNPGIGAFAHRVVQAPAQHPRFIDYPTAATLVVGFNAGDWGDVDWWSGDVIDFVVPRDL